MTNPGDIEPLATKVVPYYVTGYDEDLEEVPFEQDETPEPAAEPEPVETVPRTSIPGVIAVLLAIVTIVVHVIAVATASGGSYPSATVLAWVAIGFSIAAVLAGIVSVIGRFGRGYGIAAIVLGLIANPVLLLGILTLVGGTP